jgi:hypothetical protein
MVRFTGVAILAAAIVVTGERSAHGFGRVFSSYYASCYCPPVTVVYVPVAPVTPLYCQPVVPTGTPQRMYAIPKPAPASQTSEPPVNSPTKRSLRDARSLGGDYSGADQCKVGFWNLSGREIAVKVNGSTRVIPPERAVMLDLAHEFVWHVDGREPQRVRVPDDKAAHEIVLR